MWLSDSFALRYACWWPAVVASAMVQAPLARAAAAENGAPAPPPVLDSVRPSATTDATASSAPQSARDEAAQHFEAARLLFAQGNYELAAAELERAYALVPDPRVLHKLGKLWLHLQRHAQARRTFEKYLEQSGPELSPESRAQVEADLEQLREKTATLELNVNLSGSEVFVDDISFGHSPLPSPLVLETGEHHVVLRKQGYVTHEARLTLSGNEARRVDVVLEPEVPAAPPPGSVRVEPPRPEARARPVEPTTTTSATLTWVAWSATGVLAAGAATAGVLGLVAANELDTLKDDPNASREALERQASRAELGLITADILAGATLLAAGGALYLTLSGPQESPRRSARAVSVRVSPGSVTFTTAF